ncbi:MAG: hypothetical protein RL264_2509 [Bacteroidota bacterium]|jgi:hypothetical protein
MKKSTLLLLLPLFILMACGKYEKPFISFKSPEKRIMDKVWKTTKFTDKDGNEVNQEQTLELKIEGDDSLYTRTIDGVTVSGEWSWLPATDGKWDKQRLVLKRVGGRNIFDISVLTSKKLEITARDGATTAGNVYAFEVQ